MAIKMDSFFTSTTEQKPTDPFYTVSERARAFKRAVGVLRDGADRFEITDTETGEVFTVTRRIIPKEN